MQIIYLLSLFFVAFLDAKYLDNHSCKECHENIYEEFQSSYHAKNYFNDEFHQKIADHVDKEKYSCATCHMPMANNLADLISGKAKPDINNKTHTDAISCYFCHTIAYVKKAHKFNINTKARQAKDYKPTLYGRLKNPDDNDKHTSLTNPIYAKVACMGCHSHKRNDFNTTIFRAMDENQDSIKCIECHMPKVEGGAEKMDKRARGHHASHKFLGIHDKEFRKKGVDLNISYDNNTLKITLKNKMAHPLIIQPARAKYIKIEIIRSDKVIWKNYKLNPSEDKQGYFAMSFKDANRSIIIPATATSMSQNNLKADEKKVLTYQVGKLKKGDKIIVSLMLQLAKSDCAKVIDLKDANLTTPQLIKKLSLKL